MRSEFKFIQEMRLRHGLSDIGDDCAVLPRSEELDLLLTADLLIQDIDFRLQWTRPELLGYKALAVSLSDIAAMGGEPEWGMISIGVPEALWAGDFVDCFYDGWHELAAKYSVRLIGGDVSRTPDGLVIDSIAGGKVPAGEAILRSTARPGDLVFVSGTIGGAAAGLAELEAGLGENAPYDSAGSAVRRQLRPEPQVVLGMSLRSKGLATSMIDVSDGLSSDLRHLCEESMTGARIDASLLPLDPSITHSSSDRALQMALNGGEDYELLFTTAPDRAEELSGLPVQCIGVMTREIGKILIADEKSERDLPPGGFEHFDKYNG